MKNKVAAIILGAIVSWMWSSAPALAASRCPSNIVLTDAVVAQAANISLTELAALKTNRRLTNNDVCLMPADMLAQALSDSQTPPSAGPSGGSAFYALQQRDSTGTIKPNGWAIANAQRQAMLGNVAGLNAPSQWTAIGPGNIGGRIRSIVIHPTNPNKIWIGSVSGGIWVSSDAGASWAPVNDFMANLAVSTMAIDPTNPNVMYAGTGEGFYNGDGLPGQGVFKSTDGGVTWTKLAATTGTAWTYVNRIAVDPTNSQILLAGTRAGCYRSTDGGTTWTQVSTVETMDIRFDPNNGNNAIRGRSDGMISYTRDAGATWAVVPVAGTSRIEIAYAKSAPNMVYASVDTASGSIYQSLDGGATWTLKSVPAHLGNQGWYADAIWVDPTNSSHLLIAGLDMFQSWDAGATWTQISTWYLAPGSPHADHHVIVSDPGYNGTTNKKIYNGNDGGIYFANDISTVTSASNSGWVSRNNGLAITQFYSGAGAASASSKIIGGAQDNGSLVYTGNSNGWTAFFGGDGGYSAVDTADPNYLYGEYVYLQIHRSTDGGLSSNYIKTGITEAGTTSANFIAPFILDPNDNNRMLAGGSKLWVSANVKAATPTWASIKAATAASSPISAIAVAKGNSNIIWVGHNDGSVYYTSNGLAATPTWTLVSSALPARYVNRILIDPTNSAKVYVAFGGYSADNLYVTVNSGSTWQNLAAGLPAAPIRAIALHPSNAGWLYVGTEVGIFASADGGATWTTSNSGPANVSVTDLFWMDSTTLVAATYGRGMYSTTIASTPAALPVTKDIRSYVPAANVAAGYTSYLRLINTSATATPVNVAVIDGTTGSVGTAAQLNASLPAGAAITYSAQQVEALVGAIAAGTRPRIRVSSNVAIEVQSFMANPGGVVTQIADAMTGGTSDIVYSYVPAANSSVGYTSYIRVINVGAAPTAIQATVIDGNTGAVGATGQLTASLAAGAAVTFSAQQIEAAMGVALPAANRPRIQISGTSALEVQSFMANPGGAVTQISGAQTGSSVAVRSYIPAANAAAGYTSFIRVINNSASATAVNVSVIDGNTGLAGASGQLTASLAAGAAVTFSASQVEAALGVSLPAQDRPRITVSSPTAASLSVQSFMSNPGGAVTQISGAQSGSTINERTYLPAANAAAGYTSYLRVINMGAAATPVTVTVIDGNTGALGATGQLTASLPAGAAVTYTAQQVEAAMGVSLPAGDRPRIRVSANVAIDVQSFMSNPGGVVTETVDFQ